MAGDAAVLADLIAEWRVSFILVTRAVEEDAAAAVGGRGLDDPDVASAVGFGEALLDKLLVQL